MVRRRENTHNTKKRKIACELNVSNLYFDESWDGASQISFTHSARICFPIFRHKIVLSDLHLVLLHPNRLKALKYFSMPCTPSKRQLTQATVHNRFRCFALWLFFTSDNFNRKIEDLLHLWFRRWQDRHAKVKWVHYTLSQETEDLLLLKYLKWIFLVIKCQSEAL